MTLQSILRAGLLVAAVSLVLIGCVSAAGPYDTIFADNSLSSAEKLDEFTVAAGWTPELEGWLAYRPTADMNSAANATRSEPGIIEGVMRAFGLAAAAPATAVAESKYTSAEDAAFEQQLTDYRAAYASNYMATAAFAGSGSGTAGDPYIITTPAELQAMQDDLSAYYRLGNDIDLTGIMWTPVGSTAAPFTGNLDGDGYAIANLQTTIILNDFGLFAYTSGATITKIDIRDVDITASFAIPSDKISIWVGGLVAHAYNTDISYCMGSGNIDITYSASVVSYQVTTGIIVGYLDRSHLNDCYVDSANIRLITTTSMYPEAAGVAGRTQYGSTLSNSYTTATVDVSSSVNYYGPRVGSVNGLLNDNSYIYKSVGLSNTIYQREATRGVGRITSSEAITPAGVVGCYANADMLVNGAVVTDGTTNNYNGAGVAPSTYHTQAFWESTMGWDFDTVWYWDDTDQLPKLRAFMSDTTPIISDVAADPAIGGITTEITLSATVINATSMQWQFSADGGTTWQDITGATTTTATWTPGVLGEYQVRLQATNADGTTTSGTVTVTIFAAPTVSASVTPTEGPLQQVITLTGTISDPGTAATTYQWQTSATGTGDWTDLPDATADTYMWTVTALGTTYYRLSATGTGGTAYSDPVAYTAYAPPTVSVTIAPTEGPVTQSLTLSATVTDPGTAVTAYQWQQYTSGSWTNISGATTNPYTYAFSGAAGVYQFRLGATGTGGTAYSDPVTYTAVAAPTFSAAAVTPTSGSYPLTVDYAASASDTTTYQWQMSADAGVSWTNISTTASGQYTHQTEGTYLWRVTATGIGGSTTSAAITVTVTNPPPVFTSVSVTPTSGALDQVFTLSASASDTTTYQWQSSPTGSAAWTNIVTGASATYTFPAGTQEGTYQIRVVANGPGGSTSSTPIQITLSDVPTVTVTAPASGSSWRVGTQISFAMTASSSPTSYHWDFGDGSTATTATATHAYASTGTYTITATATNQYGSGSKTVVIYIGAVPTASITAPASGSSWPVGSQVSFTATGTGATSWQWNFGDNSAYGTTQNTQHTYTNPGTYAVTLIASNAYGDSINTITVVIGTIPQITITSPSTNTLLRGQQYTFSATAQSTTPVTNWRWSFSDGGTASGQTVSHTFTTTGSHQATVTAQNSFGTGTWTMLINVVVAPSIRITQPSNDYGRFNLNTPVSFAASVQGTNPSVQWNFGDGSTGSGLTTTHTYAQNGVYSITATASNSYGSAVDTIHVTIGDTMSHRPTPTGTLAPVPTQGFYNFMMALVPSSDSPIPDVAGAVGAATEPYTKSAIGNFFWLIIFAVPYFIIWMQSKNIMLPSILGILFGAWMLAALPGSYYGPAIGILLISITGGIINVFKPKP